MAETTINGSSRITITLLTGILGAMFWGGWNASSVNSAVGGVQKDVNNIQTSLKEFPTRFELQMLVKASISDETKDLREKFGALEARTSALEKPKDKQ